MRDKTTILECHLRGQPHDSGWQQPRQDTATHAQAWCQRFRVRCFSEFISYSHNPVREKQLPTSESQKIKIPHLTGCRLCKPDECVMREVWLEFSSELSSQPTSWLQWYLQLELGHFSNRNVKYSQVKRKENLIFIKHLSCPGRS